MTATISCTEPYALQTNTFEDALVIEATVTNELKKQEIKISRTFQLEQTEPIIEKDATVYITDDIGNQYNFIEENDKYISEFEFEAIPERQYQLFVNTSDGKHYTSTREKLTTISPLTEVKATRKNSYGVEGVEITANSYDPTGNSKYYRFEYEETHKIIVPYPSKDSLIVYGNSDCPNASLGETLYTFEIVERSGESETCYKTNKSTEILLENTSSKSIDKIDDFSIRFISKEDYIISNRYSILVKQYVQNLNSYTFYKTLKKLSASGSILSPSQPGFINGNILNINNPNEKVIGFFDISSYSEKRIFFNYNDVFPDEEIPPYFYNCEVVDYDETLIDCSIPILYGLGKLGSLTARGTIVFYGKNLPHIYRMVPYQCGDCRTIGSNVVPSFWQ